MKKTIDRKLDPLIEEIHEVRRAIAERFDFDVHRISEDAKRRQQLEGRPQWKPAAAVEQSND
jgi:hypothetical protein